MTTEIVNDLQLTVSTINGDYSVSTNDTLARVLFELGLDVTTRRIFPSNIKGAPSRYVIRVNEQDFMAPAARSDWLLLLIAENAEKLVEATVENGVVIYDPFTEVGETIETARSAKNTAQPLYRSDLVYYSVPLAELARENFSDARMKDIMRNVIYVGVLAELLNIPGKIVRDAFETSFSEKGEEVVKCNFRALDLGRRFVREELSTRDNYTLEPRERDTKNLFMKGNDATALGTVMGGCTYASWYPITPATGHGENLERYSQRYPLIVEQGENEDSCLGRALGAAWAGARASVSTSGPGLSNMAEFVGYSSFTELPVVIFDIQRVGPSTGLPTHTKQGDLRSILHLSHDESPRIVLTPSSLEQLYEYSHTAFDLAAEYQLPVFVISDLELGMSFYTVDEFEYPSEPIVEGKVLSEADLENIEAYKRYGDPDADGISYRSFPGAGPTYVTRGAYHKEDTTLSETPEDCRTKLQKLFRKMETLRDSDDLPEPEVHGEPEAEIGFVAFGSSYYALREARQQFAAQGVRTAFFDLPVLNPLPETKLRKFLEEHSPVFVVEQNYTGQLMSIIREKLGHNFDLKPLRRYDGDYLTAKYIRKEVEAELDG